MALTVITPTSNPDTISTTGLGIVPGTPDSVVSFPASTGTVSLGLSQIASGIINLYPGSGSSTGTASVAGLTATDIVLTSFDTDSSGSARFFTQFVHGTDTISVQGVSLSGSYAECHYVVFRP